MDIVSTFAKYIKGNTPDFETTFNRFDKKLKEAAGTTFLRLNGCPKCNVFVYTPEDKSTHCPHTKLDGTVCGHPRYDAAGKALEVC